MPRDRLAELLRDTRDVNELQRRINYLSSSQELHQSKKQQSIISCISRYVDTTAKSPLEILCEREKFEELFELYNKFELSLPPRYRMILRLKFIDGRTQREIARAVGISQAAVSKAITRIAKIIAKNERVLDYITPPLSMQEAKSPKVKVRYPSEYLSRICVGGRRGKRVWIPHTQCKTVEYLDESFGDEKTVCAYCERCKNKTMKERVLCK